jgi:hypothetical protein
MIGAELKSDVGTIRPRCPHVSQIGTQGF